MAGNNAVSDVLFQIAKQGKANSERLVTADEREDAGVFTAVRTLTVADTPYTLTPFDGAVFFDTSGGAITAVLPTAVGIGGRIYAVIDSGNGATNSVTVITTGGETINGEASIVIDVDYGGVMVQSDGSAWFSIACCGLSNAMVWKGKWVDGEYKKNEVVTAGLWTRVALEDTDESAGIFPIGEAVEIVDLPAAAPAWAEQSVNTASLIVGQRITPAGSGYILAAEYYIPASTIGFSCELWFVVNPATAPEFIVIVPEFIITAGTAGSFIQVGLGNIVVPAGITFDIVAMFKPVTGATTFTYDWDYVRNNGTPGSGEAFHHSGGGSDELVFHEDDDGGTDRSSDLNNIGAGSTIKMLTDNFVWEVLSVSKAGNIYTFIVDPPNRASAGMSGFEFTYVGQLPVPYYVSAGHYSTITNIKGFLSTSGYDPISSPPTLNDDAYGINLLIQDAYISDKWDTVAYSG